MNCCANYLSVLPDITVYINCDTRLAINLRMFDLSENDEFIFAIKNYDYIDSPYVFIHRARKADIDENGEIMFKITPATSKQIKPGAFYNFAVLADAFDLRRVTEYKKLTGNGNIKLEYGAQDLEVKTELTQKDYEPLKARLEQLDDRAELDSSFLMDILSKVDFEPLNTDVMEATR